MTDSDESPKKGDKAPPFGANEIVDFVEDHWELGQSPDGMLFATPRNGRGARRAVELRSLRPEVTARLKREQGIVPGGTTMSAAFDTLQGIAATAPVQPVYIRAAQRRRTLYVDLGDREQTFVEVSPYGWEIITPDKDEASDPTDTYPLFRRTAAVRPLPVPESGGTRDDLRHLLGLAADDPRWFQLWGWLVAALLEDYPRPLLWVTGPQGSGKSTRAKMILCAVDPVGHLGREPGKNERDDTTSVSSRFIPSWDNISTVSAATSDWLCRLTTGVEVARRTLYSDDDVRISTLRRTGVATSISLPYGLMPDAVQRLVLVNLDRVADDERRSEASIWAEFDRYRARILGAVLSDVAGVLENLPRVHEETLPRMADYATVLHALDLHAGIIGDGFASAYLAGVDRSLADVAEEDDLTAGLLKFIRTQGGSWRGTATALHSALDLYRPDDRGAGWPRSAKSLSEALRRKTEVLRAAGLVAEPPRSNKDKRWTFRLDEETPDAEETPEPVNGAEAPSLDAEGPVGPPRLSLGDLFPDPA